MTICRRLRSARMPIINLHLRQFFPLPSTIINQDHRTIVINNIILQNPDPSISQLAVRAATRILTSHHSQEWKTFHNLENAYKNLAQALLQETHLPYRHYFLQNAYVKWSDSQKNQSRRRMSQITVLLMGGILTIVGVHTSKKLPALLGFLEVIVSSIYLIHDLLIMDNVPHRLSLDVIMDNVPHRLSLDVIMDNVPHRLSLDVSHELDKSLGREQGMGG